MGNFCAGQNRRHRRQSSCESGEKRSTQRISHSRTTGQVYQALPTTTTQNTDKMYSPFRGLRRAHSNSTGSLLVLPAHSATTSSNFSYPYPRTHTTLVVPPSAIQQRDRTPLFDDSPTSGTPSNTFGQQPQQFRRPPLNRAIPPIPESKSNESIISQASQLTHRHSISGTSASLSQKESIRATIVVKDPIKSTDTSIIIENRMAQNLGTRFATNLPIAKNEPLVSVIIEPSTSKIVEPVNKPKKTVAIITTKRMEEVKVPKPTRLPLATNKKVRTNRDSEPKSPLMSMAHSVRSRLTKLGTRIGRATSKSPIRSSRSMVSMRRDTSNLDRNTIDNRLPKSTSEQPVAGFEIPLPPTTSPPHDDELDEQPPGEVVINSQRSVSQIPRRLPTTTLIPSPVGIYFRRLPEEDRLAMCENEGPILTIDSKEALPTPDENQPPVPILLLRKVSDEINEIPLQNKPSSDISSQTKRHNFRHKHSHSFGGNASDQSIRTPKLTARLIIRHPTEPLYYQGHHRRSKSRDAIMGMQTPKAIKRMEPKISTGDESVKTTRSLKIVTYSITTPELTKDTVEEVKTPKPAKKAHQKSSSVDISTVCAAARKYSTTGNSQSTPKRGSALCTSSSASKADEMRLNKHSLIPKRFEPRTVKWINKKRAPLAIAEQTRVAGSPAVELPPNGFEDADLRMRQSRLTSPARARRMIFWRSKSKSASEKHNEHKENDRNNNSKSVDQPNVGQEIEEFRTYTTARITTRPPASPEIDSNGNNVENTTKTEREARLGRLTLNDLLSSPLTSHKRIGNTRALQAKQRSGLIDDEIVDQPNLISTELALIDEQTPSHSFLGRDLNENFENMASTTTTTVKTTRDGDGNMLQQRTVRVRENDQGSAHIHYVPSTTIQQQPLGSTAQSISKIAPHEHAAIEKIIEDLSGQLSRIKEYAIEDEDEMQKLRVENDSLKEELQIKDQVIQLLMNRLKSPDSQQTNEGTN